MNIWKWENLLQKQPDTEVQRHTDWNGLQMKSRDEIGFHNNKKVIVDEETCLIPFDSLIADKSFVDWAKYPNTPDILWRVKL